MFKMFHMIRAIIFIIKFISSLYVNQSTIIFCLASDALKKLIIAAKALLSFSVLTTIIK